MVKGTKFVNLRDAGDPVECAKEYDRQGADELVFLDITASAENRATMIDVVERTASECFMPLTVGGGIRTRRRRPRDVESGRGQMQCQHGGSAKSRSGARGRGAVRFSSASSSPSTPNAC